MRIIRPSRPNQHGGTLDRAGHPRTDAAVIMRVTRGETLRLG